MSTDKGTAQTPVAPTLIIGQHAWGYSADSVAVAKRNWQNNGGRLSLGYTRVTFMDGQTFAGVDQLGRVHWDGDGEPVVTEVQPRGVAARKAATRRAAAAGLGDTPARSFGVSE